MASAFKTSNITVSTSLSAIYTAPGSTTSIALNVTFTNKHASADRVINLVHYDSSGTSAKNIITNLTITSEDTFIYNDKIVLETGDEIRASVDTGTDVEAVINVLEMS